MALDTQALDVVGHIGAAFVKRRDVIAFAGQSHAPMTLAFGAQRLGSEELGAQSLQLAAGDSLGRIDLL